MTVLISMPKNEKDNFSALLTKRMAEKGDFPAFSESVQHLDELMQDEDKNIAALGRFLLVFYFPEEWSQIPESGLTPNSAIMRAMLYRDLRNNPYAA